MYFIINFDIKDGGREEKFLQTAKYLGDVLQFLPNSLLMYFESGVSHTKDSIYEHLKKVLNDDDLIFVCKVSFSDMAGWLTSSTIKWLSEHNKKT